MMSNNRNAIEQANSFIRIGVGSTNSNSEFLYKIKEAVALEEMPERFVVEGATVVCTQMQEAESQSKMKKMDPTTGKMVQGSLELVHTDIEFEPCFTQCRYCGGNCEPEIEGEEWQDYDETNKTNGSYGLLKEKSFMICTKGFGLLYISEDGQRPNDMQALLAMLAIKYGDPSLLGKLMNAAFGGDPVNLATGNFISSRTDMEIKGQVPLKFTRFYNTMGEQPGALGKNWTHSYDINLTLKEDCISISFEDGHQEDYTVNDKGEYKAPDGVFDQLTKTNNGYRLQKSDQTALFFNEKGQLTIQVNPDGEAITLTYSGDHIISVNAISGSLTFTYKENKITSFTDHTGRNVTFTYENNLLTKVTDLLGNVRTYEYDGKGRFISENNPEGNLIVENVYDEQDRTVKQRYADGSEMEYIYNEEEKTTEFIQQNGAKIIYERDDLYRTTGIIYPDGGKENFKFNKLNQKISITDRNGNRTFVEYDDNGNVNKVTNPLGHISEMDYREDNQLKSVSVNGKTMFRHDYDHEGNLIVLEDCLKRKTTFSYLRKGLPETVTQADGSQLKLVYDERQNITEIMDAFGVTTTYHYDNLNRVTMTIDGNGNQTHYRYDVNDNIVEVKNAQGNIRSYTYNKANKVTQITDFNGGQITYDFNVLNKPSKITDQLGRVTTLNYDVMWNVSQVIQPNGTDIQFVYGENNRLETIRKPDGNTIQYQYDFNGNKIGITDELGNQTHLTYDAMNQMIEVKGGEGLHFTYTYNENGQVTSVTDALENTVYLLYDEAGQLIEEINPLGDSRSYTYTQLGKVETVTDEAGRVTKYEYELGGRLKNIHYPDQTKESVTYDSNGNIKTHTNQIGQTTTYHYDSLDRIIQITHPNGGKKSYTYDAVSNVTSVTDELGNKTTYEYTLTGQLAKVIDALGFETSYLYDTQDQLIEVCRQGKGKYGLDSDYQKITKQNEENQQITRYHRNKLGQVKAVTDALGQTEKYRYNPTGQLIEKLDKEGYLTKYGYTAQGDVNHIQYADGKEVKLSYNPLRQLTEVKDWLGITQIEVDPLGRPTKVTDYQNQEVSYLWGSAGERKQITYPDGKEVVYHYDNLLRLIEVQDEEQKTHYNYDVYSRLTEKQYPNHSKTKYHYNKFGQLQELSHHNQNEQLDRYYYQYDLLGNKIRIDKSRQGLRLEKENGRYRYDYDALNRLERVIKENDVMNRYQYDAFGNRTKKIEKDKEITYHFNQLNQLISSRDSQGVAQSYHYDKRGNLTDVYKGNFLTHQYHFGALNRLEYAFNHEKDLGATYRYNGLGHRVGKIEGKALEPMLPDMKLNEMMLNPTNRMEDTLDFTKQYHNLLERRENGNSTSFIWDFGVLSAQSKEDTLHYLHDDLGSPIRLLNEHGTERDIFDYDEFGNSQHRSFGKQPFTYTGYQLDDISNTLFAQAREYDPHVGRFVSEDLIKGFTNLPQSLNPYIYCWNQPLDFVDLDGKILFPPVVIQDPDDEDTPLGVPSNLTPKEAQLKKGLDKAVRDYANPAQKFGTYVAGRNTSNSLNTVLRYDDEITASAKKHGIPKEAIQAVMFQELRFYNPTDLLTDTAAALGIRPNASTGLGQIQPKTAIEAFNALKKTDFNPKDKVHLLAFWKILQNDKYNIYMIGLVLKHKTNELYKKLGREPSIFEVMKAYNGSGDLAEKYKEVVTQYFELFQTFNNSCEEGWVTH